MENQPDLFPTFAKYPASANSPVASRLPVLSIRQPWAWLILNGGKDIENRTWPTKFRGRFLIHASKGMTREEYEDAERTASKNGVTVPPFAALQRGGIIGQAEILDCVADSSSPWFYGPYGFVISNARSHPFHPCRGALGFFQLDEDSTNP